MFSVLPIQYNTHTLFPVLPGPNGYNSTFSEEYIDDGIGHWIEEGTAIEDERFACGTRGTCNTLGYWNKILAKVEWRNHHNQPIFPAHCIISDLEGGRGRLAFFSVDDLHIGTQFDKR